MVSIWCKIFKVCLTILGHYALKGLKISNSYKNDANYLKHLIISPAFDYKKND